MSIAHWLICHFDLKKFRPNEVKRVKISLVCVFAIMAIGWPLIIYKTRIMGWIKFWLMPCHGWAITSGFCVLSFILAEALYLWIMAVDERIKFALLFLGAKWGYYMQLHNRSPLTYKSQIAIV